MKANLNQYYENVQNEKAKSFAAENIDLLSPALISSSLKDIAQREMAQLVDINDEEKKRIWSELFGFGPIEPLLYDEDVTEILCNQSSYH